MVHARAILEYGALCHLDTIETQDFESGVRWIMLNDTVPIFIGEYCKVIFCAQMPHSALVVVHL